MATHTSTGPRPNVSAPVTVAYNEIRSPDPGLDGVQYTFVIRIPSRFGERTPAAIEAPSSVTSKAAVRIAANLARRSVSGRTRRVVAVRIYPFTPCYREMAKVT